VCFVVQQISVTDRGASKLQRFCEDLSRTTLTTPLKLRISRPLMQAGPATSPDLFWMQANVAGDVQGRVIAELQPLTTGGIRIHRLTFVATITTNTVAGADKAMEQLDRMLDCVLANMVSPDVHQQTLDSFRSQKQHIRDTGKLHHQILVNGEPMTIVQTHERGFQRGGRRMAGWTMVIDYE